MRDQSAEIVLGGAQLFAEQAYELAAAWRRHLAPNREGLCGSPDSRVCLLLAGFGQTRYQFAGNGRAGGKTPVGERSGPYAKPIQNGERVLAHRCKLDNGSIHPCFASPTCACGRALGRHGVDLAESIFQERRQRHVLLTNKPVLSDFSGGQQVKHGADGRGRRDLDRGQGFSTDISAVDFVGVGFLHQLAVVTAAHCHENYDNILQRSRDRVFQNVLQHIPAVAQAQIVEQRAHDRSVAGVSNGAIIEVADLSFESVTQAFQARRRC